MTTRRRFKQTKYLRERLITFADEVRTKAFALPPGEQRNELLRKARQAETASRLDEWVNSPGLQPPD
jgi:hypothetical protein